MNNRLRLQLVMSKNLRDKICFNRFVRRAMHRLEVKFTTIQSVDCNTVHCRHDSRALKLTLGRRIEGSSIYYVHTKSDLLNSSCPDAHIRDWTSLTQCSVLKITGYSLSYKLTEGKVIQSPLLTTCKRSTTVIKISLMPEHGVLGVERYKMGHTYLPLHNKWFSVLHAKPTFNKTQFTVIPRHFARPPQR